MNTLMRWRTLLALGGVFAILLLTGFFVVTRPNVQDSSKATAESQRTTLPSPTPFPFQELTIPYLTTRDYQSQLGERSLYQTQPAYTSYLTSYDSDGLRVDGLLTIPSGQMPDGGFPAVVFVHGYIPPASYQTTERYESYVDFLARNGLVVFKIDLRGHGNSEGEAGGAYYSGDYVIDTLNAHAALASSEFVDPKRIGLWGHSMAGNIVFRSQVANPDIKATVIWAGAVYTYEDMQAFGIDDNSYRPPPENTPSRQKRNQLFELYGPVDPTSLFWSQVIPTNYLDQVSGAVQIHHALDDSVTSIEYSRNLAQILEAASVDHQLLEYPYGGHNISGASFAKAMSETLSFYRLHLGVQTP